MIWEEDISKIRAIQLDKFRSLLDIKRMDKVQNAWIRELCSDERGWTKGLMKVFSNGLAMWRGWRMTGLLRHSM